MKITLRTDSIEVEGYVNAVGRDSRMLMDENGYSFREQIDPGTFAKALRAKADAQQEISLLLDHIQTRAMDGNVYTYREQDEIVPPAPPVDNGKYYNIIKELKERSR